MPIDSLSDDWLIDFYSLEVAWTMSHALIDGRRPPEQSGPVLSVESSDTGNPNKAAILTIAACYS